MVIFLTSGNEKLNPVLRNAPVTAENRSELRPLCDQEAGTDQPEKVNNSERLRRESEAPPTSWSFLASGQDTTFPPRPKIPPKTCSENYFGLK